MHTSGASPTIKRLRRQAYRFLAVQGVVVLVMAVIACYWGLLSAWSVCLGGASVLIPGACFIVILFKTARARDAKQIVSRMYMGATIKLLLSAGIALLFARYAHPLMFPFWAGFVGAQLGHWLAPCFVSMDVTR